ncbi:MAG: DinB family protein [Dehalococcoidia bacterium]
MDRNASTVQLLDALKQTPLRFQAASREVPDERLGMAGGKGEWSANEILWHIRAAADVYGEHIARMLDEEAPGWRHVSPRARMKKVRYKELPFSDSLAAFEDQRAQLVARLESLAPAAWQRFAIIRVEKKDHRLMLRERVWGMASHESVHCDQVEAVLAPQ